jgi:hypothetical protein
VIVPDRDGPFVAATVNVTAPDPLPLDPDVIVIHGALLVAVQAHSAAALTLTVRVPPPASTFCVNGETSKLQTPDCVTANVWAAIVSEPLRDAPDMGSTLKLMDADPFPVAPEVMETHVTPDVAVHVHSGLEARTSTLPVPPACGNVASLCESWNLHSAAACVICARCPFNVIPPVRVTGSALVAALNWTLPSP